MMVEDAIEERTRDRCCSEQAAIGGFAVGGVEGELLWWVVVCWWAGGWWWRRAGHGVVPCCLLGGGIVEIPD